MLFPIPDKATLWIIKACAFGVLLLGATWGIWSSGYRHGTAKLEAERAAHKAVLDDLAVKTARAARLAEEASRAATIERQANDKRFDDAKRQADQAGRDLAAALRAGAQRLQPWWDCPARSADGDAAAAASGQDGNTDLRAASASRVVGLADHADRWIGWLQTELISTRKACEVTP